MVVCCHGIKRPSNIEPYCISQFQAWPPRATPGDSHILVAPVVWFFPALSCPRVLNQSKSSIILKKSAIFALSLRQLSSSSFPMFIYARSEQCDLGPLTLWQIHSVSEFIHWEFIWTPLFTRVQIQSLFRFVQLCCKFTWVNEFTQWYKRAGAYLGNLIFIHFFLRINFYPDWSQSLYCV